MFDTNNNEYLRSVRLSGKYTENPVKPPPAKKITTKKIKTINLTSILSKNSYFLLIIIVSKNVL